MKKRYLALFIPLFIFLLIPQARADWLGKRYSTDAELYMPNESYIQDSQVRQMFEKIKTDFPNWYNDYDYAVTYSTSTQTRIRLVPKSERNRYFLAKINDDSSADIDQWRMEILTGTESWWLYTFTTSTGAYVSRTSTTGTLSISITGELYYTSFPLKTMLGYYTTQVSQTSLVDMTSISQRTLPSNVLVWLGSITQETADIIDSNDRNTDKVLGFWDGIAYTVGGWFFGQQFANDYKEALINGETLDIVSSVKQQFSQLNIFEVMTGMIKSLVDIVFGIILFIYKTIELFIVLAVKTLVLVGQMAVKTTVILGSLNAKLANTPTLLTPIYQASFAIFPAIMGLGIIKFFFRIFRG
jgi:hypothetical protein